MVHADVAVAGGGQLVDGGVQHLQFGGCAGQVIAVDAPLRHEALGQVGVVEHRQAVGLQADHFFDGAGKAFRGLLGQAVDQVEVDRAELQGARGFDQGAGLLQALQAVDRALHGRVEVLHAQADAVETQLAEQAHGRPVGFARVDLDAVVAGVVVQQVEVLAQGGHQLAQFHMAEESWRTAAEMQLLDTLFRVEVAGDQLDFLLQALQVGRGAATVLGDDLVAGAVVADVGAERHMHVQRQWARGSTAFAQGVEQVERAHFAVQLHGGRVGGVAWPGQIVAADQVGIPTKVVEHEGGPRKEQQCPGVYGRL
ncbi:hypothetical protein D3C78_612610 [compost metagenome]